MPASICQGLESFLEPCLEPRVLRLELAQSKSNPLLSVYKHCNEEINTAITAENITNHCSLKSSNNAGLSFLQSISSTNESDNNNNYNNSVYVHPLEKNSFPKLSEKSLEMCTESLGSETGKDGSECSEEISLLSLETKNPFYKQRPKTETLSKKSKRSSSFPPPLTSISSSNGIQVLSHREGGRLILKAMAVSPSPSRFLAERGNGRLKLRLLESEIEEEELEVEEEGIYENNGNSGGTSGIGKFPGPMRRCYEGRRGNRVSLIGEQFWVAT